MKKLFMMALLCAMPVYLLAQYTTAVVTDPTPHYMYVGSLSRSPGDAGNFQKLKVEVFGGGWLSDAIGETTYYIANRNGLVVHRVILGGANNDLFSLQAYDNGTDNIDFYIVTTDWAAIALRSVMLGGATPVTANINIITSTAIPPGTLHTLTVVPVITTDQFGRMAMGTDVVDDGYQLSVAGSVRADKVVVATGWADYVFNEGYSLMPLNKVADYVHINHHLQGVPTTAEVKKNGADVGDMEVVLLKKIEELTLYLIEKDTQQEKQEEKIAQLQKQVDALIKINSKRLKNSR